MRKACASDRACAARLCCNEPLSSCAAGAAGTQPAGPPPCLLPPPLFSSSSLSLPPPLSPAPLHMPFNTEPGALRSLPQYGQAQCSCLFNTPAALRSQPLRMCLRQLLACFSCASKRLRLKSRHISLHMQTLEGMAGCWFCVCRLDVLYYEHRCMTRVQQRAL